MTSNLPPPEADRSILAHERVVVGNGDSNHPRAILLSAFAEPTVVALTGLLNGMAARPSLNRAKSSAGCAALCRSRLADDRSRRARQVWLLRVHVLLR